MYCKKLKLNSHKLELPGISSLKISIAQSSASDCNLGVVFDNSLTFEKHGAVCKSAFYHLRRISKIRSYLSEESTIALIHALMTCCRLDNGNAHYMDGQNRRSRGYNLYWTAPFASSSVFLDYISALLFELHWLPVKHHIVFEILLLVFKSLNNLAPTYIGD